MTDFDRQFHITRAAMLSQFPFYGYISISTIWVPSDGVKTAEIDPHSYDVVRVNPEWFCGLEQRSKVAVIAHVVSHMAWEHLYRRGNRRKDIWQQACDLVVDEMLRSVKLQTPNASQAPPGVVVKDKSVDSVYLQLLEQEQNDGKGKGRNNATIGQDLPEEDPTVQPPDKDQDGDAEGGGQGEGDGETDPDESDTSGNGSGQGDGVDNGDGENEQQQQDANSSTNSQSSPRRMPWSEIIQRAADYAESTKGQGHVPNGLDRQLMDLHRPYVSWWQFIVQSVTTQDFKLSFARPHRSHMWRDVYIPTRRPRNPTIAIAVDTSGSISLEMLSEFVAEVRTLVESMGVGVRLIACDAAVHLDILLEPGDPVPLTMGGGGGTRFEPVFELLAEDDVPPPVLVYYTDGFGSYPDEHWPWKTLWVMTPDHREPEFGERALFEPANWRNRADLA